MFTVLVGSALPSNPDLSGFVWCEIDGIKSKEDLRVTICIMKN